MDTEDSAPMTIKAVLFFAILIPFVIAGIVVLCLWATDRYGKLR